jgi:hypothetical protein|tara:strand:+ start:246 stop:596 length:351 start_codon:yes stop_codon:yes gene_type:complete
MTLLFALILFNSIAFVSYGISCLVGQKMKSEFFRFGLTDIQRKITGISQVLGGLGLIIGYFLDIRIAILSALGLSVLMLAGFITRLKIKDPIAETLPSLLFMLLNIILTYFMFSTL